MSQPVPASDRDSGRLLQTPSWVLFREMGEGAALTGAGRAVTLWALDTLEAQLGRAWPQRQFDKQGWVPSELLGYAGWRHELPRLLQLAANMRRFRSITGFADAIRPVKRTCDHAAWNHFVLQLEVARVGHALGMQCQFEPRIAGMNRAADVLLTADHAAMHVETTTLTTGKVQREQLASERELQGQVMGLALRHGVSVEVELAVELTAQIAQACLSSLESSLAAVARTGMRITMKKSWGRAVVDPVSQTAAPGLTSFSGAPHWRNAWHRVEDALRDKARQLIGAEGAWIRIDLYDGTFGFTDWARKAMAERAEVMAYWIPRALDGFTSVDGVVVSSGAAVSLGPVDDPAATDSASTGHISMMRRPVAPGLVRETIIVPTNEAGRTSAADWHRVYDAESTWLSDDLQELGLSQLYELR